MALEIPPPGPRWMKCQVKRAFLILLLNPAFNNTHPGRRAGICLMNIASFPEKKPAPDLVSNLGWLKTQIQTRQRSHHLTPSPGGHSCQERDETEADLLETFLLWKVLPCCLCLFLFHTWSINAIQQGTIDREEEARQRQLLK